MMLDNLFPDWDVKRRDIQTLDTQTPRSCLCGQVSCQSKQGTPTGLQVQQAVSWTGTKYFSYASKHHHPWVTYLKKKKHKHTKLLYFWTIDNWLDCNAGVLQSSPKTSLSSTLSNCHDCTAADQWQKWRFTCCLAFKIKFYWNFCWVLLTKEIEFCRWPWVW